MQTLCQQLIGVAAFLLVAWGGIAHRVAGEGLLVTTEDAARLGLERAWFAQIPVDSSRTRVSKWMLRGTRLYGVSDSGIVTALHAETGETLWTKQVGRPGFPAFGPGANPKYLGVVSGAKLYMLDRADGRLLWSRDLGSAPSSGPALTQDYAYVALMTGRIEGYRLDDPSVQPWYYQSKGRTYLQPTTTGQVVSWPTSEGCLYVSRANDPNVLFRLETGDDIVTSPAESEPHLYIASLDGYLYCVDELTGREEWRYSTGFPIVSSPAVVDKTAYVASLEPTIHAVDAETGAEQWLVYGASHFAARGKNRVYASDDHGNVLALDGKTGEKLGQLKVGTGFETLVNDQSDRIFLVSGRGLVQCLREADADQPTMYRKPLDVDVQAAAAEKKGERADEGSPFEAVEPAEAPAEAAAAETPATEEDAVEAPPAEEAPAEEDDNPFGGF